MSTLNSASTLAQVEAAYADNASYAEDNSVAKARAFCGVPVLLGYFNTSSRHAVTAQLQTAVDLVQAEKKAAEEWVEAHDTGSTSTAGGPRVTRVSFENSR